MSRLIIEEPCGHPRPNTSVCVRFACTGMKRQVLAVDVDDLPTSMIEAARREMFGDFDVAPSTLEADRRQAKRVLRVGFDGGRDTMTCGLVWILTPFRVWYWFERRITR